MPTKEAPVSRPQRQLSHDPAKLRRIRFEQGLSQKGLAERAQSTPSHICDIEKGRRSPGPVLLTRIAKALSCRPADLMPDLPMRPSA